MADEPTTAETDAYLIALGNNIRKKREMAGWTPEELGNRAGGIPKTTVWRIETGKQQNPKLFQLLSIAAALGKPLRQLLPGGADDSDSHDDIVIEQRNALLAQAEADMAAVRDQTTEAVRRAEDAMRAKVRESEAAARKKVEDAAKADRDELRQLRQTNAKAARALQKALDDLQGDAE